MDVIAPTTELEAVNAMLEAIGETPVNSLSNSGVVDAVKARSELRRKSRQLQQEGWHWNTLRSYKLYPVTPSKEIILPSNTLRVDTVGNDFEINVVQRGNRLFDNDKHTYEFDRELTVDLVIGLDWEELPEAARAYIYMSAARKFQQDAIGSSELSQFHLRDEMMAYAALQAAEAENADYNVLSDSYSVVRILHR